MTRSGFLVLVPCLLVSVILARSFDVDDEISDVRPRLPFELRHAPLTSLLGLLSRDQGEAPSQPAEKEKRGGLGRCIHGCMHSGGGLNFIQCKTMCLWDIILPQSDVTLEATSRELCCLWTSGHVCPVIQGLH